MKFGNPWKYFSSTYIKIFIKIIYQHTYNFEWADLFSPTYYFTNIIFTNIKLRRCAAMSLNGRKLRKLKFWNHFIINQNCRCNRQLCFTGYDRSSMLGQFKSNVRYVVMDFVPANDARLTHVTSHHACTLLPTLYAPHKTSLSNRHVWRHKWRKAIFGFCFREWRWVKYPKCCQYGLIDMFS